jgi:hypothetical protein
MPDAVHARFSPSGFEGWSNCSEWESNPKSSSDADLGTDAHTLNELCFNNQYSPDFYLGHAMPKGNVVDQEMVEAARYWLDFISTLHGEKFVEVRLPISQITGEADAYGTSDLAVIGNRELTIVDYKFGKGVRVDAQGNGQMRLYAASAADHFDHLGPFDTARIVIVQPRLDHISEEVLTYDELMTWASQVRPATEIKPTEKGCRWCARKATCEALRQVVADKFDAIPEPKTAEADTLGEAMRMAELVDLWIKAVRSETEKRLAAGQPVTGFKLVEGRLGNRAWSSPDTAAADLAAAGIDPWVREVISPAAAEKLLGKKNFAPFAAQITRAAGRPAVAPESDPRPAIASAAAEKFDIVKE